MVSVVMSLVSCVVVIGVLIHQAPSPNSSESAYYRYRTSQAAHWRAIALRH